MGENLSKNILSTIAYYDVLDYPMTAFELWKYLIRNQEAGNSGQEKKFFLLEIINCLESDELKKNIEEYRGFYFLKGRPPVSLREALRTGKSLVDRRLESNKISEEKLKIIKRVVWFLRFVPFMRMVAITGRVAMKNAEKGSDLDLLIVLKHGHIFTGRLLTTLLVHILGKRRHGKKIKNRICLNYFITTESLEISTKDLFSSSEYFFARPIFGFKVFRKFQIKNSWIKNYHPNYSVSELADNCLVKDGWCSKKTRKILEKIFGFIFIKKMLKKWQIARIANDPRTHQKGSMVEANDNELIFLPEPQGPEVFERYQERLKSFQD